MIYLYLLCICLAIALYLQYKYKIHLYHSFKEELIYIVVLLALFVPMDIFAVSRGVWAFPGNGLLGIHIFNLPIEEYLFMIIIPYFSLIVYKYIDKKKL